MNFLLSIPKKTLILMGVLLVIIFFLVLILFNRKPETIPQPQIVVSPFQKTIPGTTTAKDIEAKYQIKNKETLPNGDLRYSLETNIIDRPDQITFHNNIATLERIVIDNNKYASGDIRLSSKISRLGTAEKIIRGSEYYGYHMDYYIYPTKGIVLIANTFTDEIYEIQLFTPTTLEQYISQYGEDIRESQPIEEQ